VVAVSFHNATFNHDVIEWAERTTKPLVVAFLDFEKVFDCVRWNYLWRVLDKLDPVRT
jgi:hypothetical protein